MPCSVLLEIEEWQALYCAIHACPTPPAAPPTLGEALRWIAQLGGLVGRRPRDHPGAETLWRGLQHLRDLTRMYCIMRPSPPSTKKRVHLAVYGSGLRPMACVRLRGKDIDFA
jgi:hypothetical protein